MDKFILQRTSKAEGYKPLIVDVTTHEKLAQIKETTGMPITRIIAQMVDFCSERLHVSED